MWSLLEDVELENIIHVETHLRENVANIHKINVTLSSKIHINIASFKVKDVSQEQLCAHMLASKMVAQITLNLYNNYYYHKDNVSYNNKLLQSIEDNNDRKLYENMIKALFEENEWNGEKLIIIMGRSILMYLTMLNVLQKIEDSLTNSQVKNKTELPKTMNGKYSKATEIKMNKRIAKNNKLIFEDKLCKADQERCSFDDKWRCEEWIMINNKRDMLCQACEKSNSSIEMCTSCHVKHININFPNICKKCEEETSFKEMNVNKGKIYKYRSVDNITTSGDDEYDVSVEKWICSRCTLRNTYDLNKCAACKTNRPLRYKWKCKRCTIFNNWYIPWCKSCGFKESIRQHFYSNKNYNENRKV